MRSDRSQAHWDTYPLTLFTESSRADKTSSVGNWRWAREGSGFNLEFGYMGVAGPRKSRVNLGFGHLFNVKS